ncbi:carboxylate--amine ligase [Adlercreutzia sp. ZJ141]|uniref:carboxylate--amine ligase n=1 Tax=Adlercreutzia sp. ZJ141 TaxID=2709406 RepID=UPI0013E9EB2B|nr:carboxylate--amine ligase [Adlercreutzia sp. ZJ141]
MSRNASYTQEYLDEIAHLDGDTAGRRAARTHMEHSTAIYHGRVVDSCYVPRLYDKQTYRRLKDIAETTHRILEKVMREYLSNPAYRSVYELDPRLVDLILLPRGYDALLPFSRVDVFLNEDTMDAAFCEFNADGSSGMNENREITASIANTEAFRAFSAKHVVSTCNEELFDGWVSEFLHIYDTYEHRVSHPHVAIVDFLESAITEEFKIFAKLFAERGVECSVYDVRDLRFDGEHLIGVKAFYGRDNAIIDAAWRRSVTNDIMEHWDTSQPLIEAVRAQKVALIGSFAGHLVHDKQIFQVLFKPETQALLTPEENAFVQETVPFTAFLNESEVNLDEVKATRERWIIKPTDAYGSKDVYAGRDCDDDEWAHIIDAHANGAAGAPFIVQRYCTPHRTLTLPLYGDEADITRESALAYNNLLGLYVYNGRFTGVFSRLGPEPVICKKTRGVTAATIWVDDDEAE